MRLSCLTISCLSICLALGAVPAAHAYDCADQTQPGLDVCADAAFKKADAGLNGAYKDILKRLKDDSAKTKLLVTAQKAWLSFRDAECAFSAAGVTGGSIYPMVVSLCLERVTKERTEDLSVYLKCEEGDTECPVPAE